MDPLGWRDSILLLVALAAVYLVFMLLKLTRLGHHVRHGTPGPVREVAQEPPIDTVSPLRRRAEASPMAMPATEPAEYDMEHTPLPVEPFADSLQPNFEWDEVRSLFGDGDEPEQPALQVTASATPRSAGGFGEHLAEHLARTDMEMEVQRMRSEMERMRNEMEELRTARRVSPQYAEAMELAQRGLSAQDLADRLGISLGEAELVHALSHSERNFDEGEEYGTEQFAAGVNGFDEFDRLREPRG